MAFGAPAGELSRKTNNSAQVADKLSNVGKITDQTTARRSTSPKNPMPTPEDGDSFTAVAVINEVFLQYNP